MRYTKISILEHKLRPSFSRCKPQIRVILVRDDLAGLHLPLTSLASAKIRLLAQKISADGEAISAVGQPRILELQRSPEAKQ